MPEHTDQAFGNSNRVRNARRRDRHARSQPNAWFAIDPVPGHYVDPGSVRHSLEKSLNTHRSRRSLTALMLADAASDLIQSP